MYTTDIDEIRQFSEFSCSLYGTNFEDLSLSDKVKACLKANIFKFYMWQKDNLRIHVQSIEIENLENVEFINSCLFEEEENQFLFASSYVSCCSKYSTSPNPDYEDEIVDLFLDNASNQIDLSSSFFRHLEYETIESSKVLMKSKIQELMVFPFKNIMWDYNHHQKDFYLYLPEGKFFFLRDCQGFQQQYLTNNYYAPDELVKEDPIMAYLSEVSQFHFLKVLNIKYKHLEKNLFSVFLTEENTSDDESSGNYRLSTLQAAVVFQELGFYKIIQEKGVKSPLFFIADLIGRNRSNLRAAFSKITMGTNDKKSNLSHSEVDAIKTILKRINNN